MESLSVVVGQFGDPFDPTGGVDIAVNLGSGAAIADRLVDRENGWLVPLLVAAGLNGALALTGIGGILSFCIGAAGFGAVLRDYL